MPGMNVTEVMTQEGRAYPRGRERVRAPKRLREAAVRTG